MEQEAVLTFIYKTIKAYSQYQDYIEQKLQGKFVKDKKIIGYLINKDYINYWKKFSDYDDLKELVICNNYPNIRPTLYKYRKSNKYQKYQPDAVQIHLRNPEELYKAVKRENKAFVLIDYNFWKLICTEKGLKEPGGVKYSLDKEMITFYFNEFDYCRIITNDNIIDSTKEIKSTGFDVIRQSDKEEKELEKLLLLYAYEQEMKNKINNLTYKENEFNTYYLISKEWILQYKKYYHYNEICKMIQGRDELKNLLNKGFEKAKQNINDVLKHISFKENKKKVFPEELKNNNTFLCEREDVLINKRYNVSFWKNFELINEELKNRFMQSDAHAYSFDSASDARCLITCGKIIIDLSKDDYNENIYACEIGTIDNTSMLYNEEYIFRYDNEEAMVDNLNFAANDFLIFQRDYLIMGTDFECELLSKEGEAYGISYKIPPHD